MFINKRNNGKFDLVVNLSSTSHNDTNQQPDIVFMTADIDELVIIIKTSILCEESGFNSINFSLEETTFYTNVWASSDKLNNRNMWEQIECSGEVSCLPENIIKFNAFVKDENDRPITLSGIIEFEELRDIVISISESLLQT